MHAWPHGNGVWVSLFPPPCPGLAASPTGSEPSSPLRLVPLPRFGPRFPALSNAYDKELRALALEISEQLGYSAFVREGVYCMVGGPNFESVAEARMLRALGVDAVGKKSKGGPNSGFLPTLRCQPLPFSALS